MKGPERAICYTVLRTSIILYIPVTDRSILLCFAHICVTHGRQGLCVLLCAYFGVPQMKDRQVGRNTQMMHISSSSAFGTGFVLIPVKSVLIQSQKISWS